MGLDEWQTALRRQLGQEAEMSVRNVGDQPVFSEYAVRNPATERTYRVVIRGDGPGVNYCSCPDFSVNTLGTCKHVEAALHRIRRRHAAALRAGYRPTFSEVYVCYGMQRTVRFSPGAACSPSVRKLAGRFFKTDGVIKSEGVSRFNTFLRAAAKSRDDIRVYDDAVTLVATKRDDRSRRARLTTQFAGPGGAARWRKLLSAELFPYQREGALFAAQAGRAIIADEMGLGKTIQAIAAAEILARNCGVQRVLVVCPASLKSQWEQEISRFSKRSALLIEGPTHRRSELYRKGEGFFKIVNYDVIPRDLEAIASYEPDLVVLDEAQRIKNWETRAARSVKRIESPFAFVLTGTPLENRIEELHSIVEFVDRHCLGPRFRFKAEHEIIEEDSTKVVGYRNLNRITKTLSPILIRRTKKQVLTQLPPRMDKNFFVPMTDQQWVPHNENREIVARIVQKWHRYHFLSEADQLRLRIALQYMRMACDSTYLVDHQTRFHNKLAELTTLLDEVFEETNAKVVIFSQWLRMNELVSEMLNDKGWGHVQLHGGVPSGSRKHLIRALHEDKACRVFLSTDAGGVGLNLQSASTVINMDLPWNPAVLEQRIGRVHRIGQKRPVRVVNLVSEGTIEHGMLSLLSFKKSMFAGVLDGATDKVLMGDGALNRFMKTVDTATSSVPQTVSTPLEQEKVDQTVSDSGSTNGKQAVSTMDDIQTEALGNLLTLGAEVLKNLGDVLFKPGDRRTKGLDGRSPIRLDKNSETGSAELRIQLPDASTINQWVAIFTSKTQDRT